MSMDINWEAVEWLDNDWWEQSVRTYGYMPDGEAHLRPAHGRGPSCIRNMFDVFEIEPPRHKAYMHCSPEWTDKDEQMWLNAGIIECPHTD